MLYECPMTFYQGEEEAKIPNSCPNLPGVDPVFNYMNYVGSERCLPEGVGRFSCGQIERMYKQWMLYREHSEDCAQNEMKIDLAMELDASAAYSDLHMEIAPIDGQPVFSWARDMHTDLLEEPGKNYTRAFNFCVPSGEYVFAVTDTERNGFHDGFIGLYVNGKLLQRVEGDFGSTECIRFGNNGKLADLAKPEADFGTTYYYQPPENSTRVTCASSSERFLEEPIWMIKDRFMRVNISLGQRNEGVCINEVGGLDIEIDGTEYIIYPRDPKDDPEPVRFESRVLSCRNCKLGTCYCIKCGSQYSISPLNYSLSSQLFA